MTCKLIWVTPNAQDTITYCAKVSNPSGQDMADLNGRLIKYCFNHAHFSVFEMASMCVEVDTTRTIARQILRHRSFSFQEFSQRYAEVKPQLVLSRARSQDYDNRQNSHDNVLPKDQDWFEEKQSEIHRAAYEAYDEALERGIAKECARILLPEGMTPSRLYMSGTIRSWLHYCQLRIGNGTQKEHQDIANEIKNILVEQIPVLRNLI